MPISEVDTTFVLIAWMLQCIGLGVFFVLVAAEYLVRSEDAKQGRAGIRQSAVIDVEWRSVGKLDARR